MGSQVLTSDFSARTAAVVMNRLAKLSARFIGENGFSIGIDDVTPAHELQVASRSFARILDMQVIRPLGLLLGLLALFGAKPSAEPLNHYLVARKIKAQNASCGLLLTHSNEGRR